MTAMEQVVEDLRKQMNSIRLALTALEALDGTSPEVSAETLTPKRRGKRRFSPAAREKMRLAQKKRWAKWHREQGAKRG